MKDMKIGFIGAGRHAKANIYPSLQLLGTQIASVCANHLESAQSIAKKYHVPRAYNDYRQMLEKENLDAVFVVLPEALHPEVVNDCLNAGVHVFVEKPLGLSAQEAASVAATSEKTGKHVMVGFMKRYAPAYVEAKKVMQDKMQFGEILSMTGKFAARPFGNEEFYLKNATIHFIDLIRFFFGDIKDVTGYSNSQNGCIDVAFSFASESGQVGNMLFAGTPSWSRHSEDITITGSYGFVKVEEMRKVTYHFAQQDYKPPAPRWQLVDEEDRIITSIDTSSSGGWKDLYLNGYVGEVEHFLKSIANGEAPTPSAADNIKTMKFCENILNAVK